MNDYIVAVDFDGTLVENRFPEIGPLFPDAAEALRFFRKEGIKIIIWTCNANTDRIRDFLIKNDVPFDWINENDPTLSKRYRNDSRKVGADMYIDDRQVGGLPSWWFIQRLVTINKIIKAVEIREGSNKVN